MPWAYVKVSANGTAVAARSLNPFGATSTSRLAQGRYQVTFTGAQAAGEPAVLLTPASAAVWRGCSHTTQSLSPVTIQVACWDQNGQFADTDFNLAFLR
jgi:hypothetical protein